MLASIRKKASVALCNRGLFAFRKEQLFAFRLREGGADDPSSILFPQLPEYRPDCVDRVFHRHDLRLRLVASLQLDAAVLEGAATERQPERDADEVRICELDPGVSISIVVEHVHAGLLSCS